MPVVDADTAAFLDRLDEVGQELFLPGDGRRYHLDVTGRFGWRARYLKEVDADETILRFWQEIYDETGGLIEIHEKFPVDKGHQKV